MPRYSLYDIWVRRNLALGIMIIVFVLGAVITSLIPLKFTATAEVKINPISKKINEPSDIKSDEEKITFLINQESDFIKDDVIYKVIEQRKLLENASMNPEINHNRSVVTKYIYYLNSLINDAGQSPISPQERIRREIINNLKFEISNDFILTITYEGPYPHITRDVTDLLAKNYVWAKSSKMTKKIIKKPDLPDFFSTPDLFYAIYCTATIAFLFGVLGAIFIKPWDA